MTALLHVNCSTCIARGPTCDDCVITVLLGHPGAVALDADEQAALAALADSGLVPPLRLVPGVRAARSIPRPQGWSEFA